MDIDAEQTVTRLVYEDIEVARAFAKKAFENGKTEIRPQVRAFAEGLNGKRLIDIGCGPGVHARQFASLGLQVTAVDYSDAMIQIAKESYQADNPTFRCLDMREIGQTFAPHSFDGAWISASLLHVPEADVPGVLRDLHRILASNGRVRISLKAGPQGPRMVYDEKYGRGMDRQFVFWREDNFTNVLRAAGFKIDDVQTMQSGMTGDTPTTWLVFHAQAMNDHI